MANTNLKLTGLDFPTLKSNFKEYLKRSDSPFKDIEYEGSNINQLLDIFAYNTYINSFYLNMVASEMFLDSATLRDSVVSHAKELNYIPRSYRSAEAKVSFTVTVNGISTLLVPKGTSFTSKVGSNNYTFSSAENLVLTANSSNVVSVSGLSIYEGSYIVDSFVYSTSNTAQRFVLSNPTIDTRSLTVLVVENSGANTFTHTRASSFLGQSANSNIYFLQAAENGQYEVLFGDNIIGRRPQNGAVIAVEYRTCNGELPNGASQFFIDGAISGQSNISLITTQQQASGGGISESIESIKYNAPRSYQNQDRAVTTTDYENILISNFPEIEAVSAFGGEDANPPQFGKVFIAVDVETGDGASQTDKNRYQEFIKKRAAIGINPEIINPEFLFISLTSNVRYNTNITSLAPSAIETLVKNAISNYNTVNLNNFKRTLRYSKLAEEINNAHPSILGIDLNIYPFKEIVPTLNTNYSATINFGFSLEKFIESYTEEEDYVKTRIKSIYSSKFVYNGTTSVIQDNKDSTIGIYNLNETNTPIFAKNIGTVDYDNGIVVINNLNISSFQGTGIHIHVIPLIKDIPATRNAIIKIIEKNTDVTVIPVVE